MGKKVLLSVAAMLIGLMFTTVTFCQVVFVRKPIASLSVPVGIYGYVERVAFSPDGKRLAVATSMGVWLYSSEDGDLAEIGLIDKPKALASIFSPDSRLLATLTRSGISSSTIYLYDLISGQEVATFKAPRLSESARRGDFLAFSSDGKLLTSAGHATSIEERAQFFRGTYSESHRICVWDVSLRKKVDEIETKVESLPGYPVPVPDRVLSIALGRNGSSAVYGNRNGSIYYKEYTLLDGSRISTGYEWLAQHRHNVSSVSLSSDGKLLASAGEDNYAIYIRDVGSHKGRIAVLKGHTSPVNSLAFSPDGKWLASGGDDQTVRLWNVALGKGVAMFRPSYSEKIRAVAFSPDGELLISADGRSELRVWDLEPIKEK